jgi:hypothetical protein
VMNIISSSFSDSIFDVSSSISFSVSLNFSLIRGIIFFEAERKWKNGAWLSFLSLLMIALPLNIGDRLIFRSWSKAK